MGGGQYLSQLRMIITEKNPCNIFGMSGWLDKQGTDSKHGLRLMFQNIFLHLSTFTYIVTDHDA